MGRPYKDPLWDDPHQADMCEIIRTLTANGYVDMGVGLHNLKENANLLA